MTYKIPKKIILILCLLLIACGNIFAQDADDANIADEENVTQITVMPKNIITVDVAPTGYFLLFTGISFYIDSDSPMYGFGIATQYERQITEKASVAGRFEYGILDMLDREPKFRMSSISAEGHGRYYPGQNVFFLDGMLGYAYIFTDFSTTDREIKPVLHRFKFGGKLGWRIDFKKPGGFVLEPAVGYYSSIGTNLETGYADDLPILGSILDFLAGNLARALFIDGLRFSLGLGYRF
ncbi:MAG: hypothetical protein LBC52_06785 [Treponema sp.]|jgi:hypothetical protein|nr:hypothetical protein [Treponema sp.]